MVGPDGTFLHINDAFSTITGYTHEELTGHKYTDVGGLEDLTAAVEELAQSGGRNTAHKSVERNYLRRNGSSVQVSVATRSLNDKQGQPLHSLWLVQEI